MIITYLRSSSYNCFDFCPQQYFAEYVLGFKGPSNKKADKGTIVHKVLENVAISTKTHQENCMGISDGTTNDIINGWIQEVYKKYTTKLTHHSWYKKDFEDCKEWTWKALNFHGGMFDPRKRTIIDVEPHFDFEIQEPWAEYKYRHKGKILKGFLSLKGTIDLISKFDSNTYEITDWKTGIRKDWATGKEKTYIKLTTDAQLHLYYFAAHYLYPDIENFIVTINFINDGGPFTFLFNNQHFEETKMMIKKRFEVIKYTEQPYLNKTWKCTTLCHQGMSSFSDTKIKTIREFRKSQVCEVGQTMTKCEQLKFEIERKGIDRVTEEYMKDGHFIDKYSAPGELDA